MQAVVDHDQVLAAIEDILKPMFASTDAMSHGRIKRDVIALMDRVSAEARSGGRTVIAEAGGARPI